MREDAVFHDEGVVEDSVLSLRMNSSSGAGIDDEEGNARYSKSAFGLCACKALAGAEVLIQENAMKGYSPVSMMAAIYLLNARSIWTVAGTRVFSTKRITWINY